MFNIDSFDDNKQENGTWVKYGGSEFLIAASDNPKYIRTVSRLVKPYKKQIEKGGLDPEVSADLTCEAMAEAVLLDWKKVRDSTGKEVTYSKEIAKTALIKNKELRNFVSEFSQEFDNFRREEISEVSGK